MGCKHKWKHYVELSCRTRVQKWVRNWFKHAIDILHVCVVHCFRFHLFSRTKEHKTRKNVAYAVCLLLSCPGSSVPEVFYSGVYSPLTARAHARLRPGLNRVLKRSRKAQAEASISRSSAQGLVWQYAVFPKTPPGCRALSQSPSSKSKQ